MQKSVLLAAIQQEIRRHDLSHFVDEPPSVAQGGRGVVVSGVVRAGKESIRCHNFSIIWPMMRCPR